jgi:lipoyl(octanoyl) transferase
VPVADSAISHSPIVLQRAGVMAYLDALELQRSLHREIADGVRENTLLLLEHPSVFTAGKRTQSHERPTDGSLVIDVDRGGKITWHGPGQLVGYPIVRLAQPTELVAFVREIESALISICHELGLETTRVEGRSGVWAVDTAGARKIAAIGIRVASGVSMHGFSLNIEPDLTAYNSIIPCGIDDASVTSLSKELGRSISTEEVLPIVEKHMYQSLAKVSR